MGKFRLISNIELALVENELERIGGKLLHEWLKRFDYIVVRLGKRMNLFGVTKSQWELIQELQDQKKIVWSSGLHLGMILQRPSRFYPSLGLIMEIAHLVDKRSTINDIGVQHFLYGKDVRIENIVDVPESNPEEKFVVFDKRGWPVGIATLASKDKKLRNVLDLGLFLRQIG